MKLERIVVIGAGTMGSGIAQWFAQEMCFVELVDNSTEQLERAKKSIFASWDKLVEKEKLTSCKAQQMKGLLEFKSLENVSKSADLVVEAIIENLDVKKELFKKLDGYFSEHTILSSNTSSFPIHLMAEAVSPRRRERFLGLHFFNPATIMKLVEVIRGRDSSEVLCRELYTWFDSHGKKAAMCKDSPGFIVNRVARNFYGEPLRIVEEDNEEKMKEVDRILKEVGGFRMGPFELMDLIGIDVNYSVTCSVWEAYNKEPRFAPHALQKKMVDEGRFGRKSKRGYYEYD
jgi:3-hydroxybutyryl-CoA dehydrogenase